ncbi:MAG TPA: nucleotide exchange factor GrpE [Anaerolineae bacterium]|nr:nucleotide exchange factor GrpE [Anaerolineae bacterium]
MTREDSGEPEAEASVEEVSLEEGGEGVEEGLPVEGEDQLAVLNAALAEAEARAAEYLDGWQRARAEFANYRRRQEQQRQQMQVAAKASVLVQLLPVMDDLKRALEAVPEESEENPWLSGVEQVQRKWQAALERVGLSVLPVEAGDAFDPNVHEALTHEPCAEVEAGKIIQVVQPGYEVDDTVLRPALVRVSSGSPGADEEEEE